MTKHTPGPWSVAYLDHNDQAVIRGEYSEVCTCWHHCVGALEKQMLYNARLISAAPEMLDALEIILPMAKGYAATHLVGRNHEMVKFAEDALAKAKGE